MTSELITSAQNPKIKRLLALQKDSAERRSCGLFVVEGRRELERCLAAGFEADTIFVCPELAASGNPGGVCPENHGRPWPCEREGPIARDGRDERVARSFQGIPPRGSGSTAHIFEVSEAVYEKVAYRGGTEGIIAEVKARSLKLEDLHLKDNPLIVVLESVEKPGNLGAVLRSADAAGADAVLICDPLTDLWNPNLVRASLGACFTVPTVACRSEEAIAWLKGHGIQILTAQLQDSELYYRTDMRPGTALVMGTESTGLSDEWRRAATSHIRIPMLGAMDSLNVSVSAAVLLYEAVRQRQ